LSGITPSFHIGVPGMAGRSIRNPCFLPSYFCWLWWRLWSFNIFHGSNAGWIIKMYPWYMLVCW